MMLPPADQSPDLTALERSVLETALAAFGADGSWYRQIDAATVMVRTPSGVGFMTKLDIPDTHPVTEPLPGAGFPVVIGEHPALSSGADFVLQIKNGRINCIEAFCHEGMWPTDESLFRLYVEQTPNR